MFDRLKRDDLTKAVLERVRNSPELRERFAEEPIQTVESIVGKDLPDEQIEKIVNHVQGKLN